MKNPLLSIFGFLIISMLMPSCEEDDSEPEDFRLALEGFYRVESQDLRIIIDDIDTTLTYDIDPYIEFEIDEEFHSDEMKIYLEDFIDELFEELYDDGQTTLQFKVTFENEDDLVAEISDGEFRVREIDFEVEISNPNSTYSIVVLCQIEITGEIDEDDLTFEYELEISQNEATYEGMVTARRR